jgi:stage II sporulation protein D
MLPGALALLALAGCASTMRGVVPGPVTDILRAPTTPRTIRVGLANGVPSIHIKVVGPGVLYDQQNRTRIARFVTLADTTVSARDGAIVLGNRLLPSTRITVLPDMPQTLWVNGVRYRGELRLLTDQQGRLVAVNVLPLENYLMGVVPRETYTSWPDAALRAQAVAARSFAVAHIADNGGRPFDVRAPAHQLYGGVDAEHPRSSKAVLDTEGEVLSYRGHTLCTFFYSCCGGHTEEAPNVFSDVDTYPRAVPSPYCRGSRHYSWDYSVAMANLGEKLRRAGKHIPGTPVAIDIRVRSASGRVMRLRVASRQGSVELTGEQLRKALGYDKLRSTLFSVRIRDGRAYFRGNGWGHGVGMCQWCSRALAENGRSYEQILQHFYPGSRLVR